MFLILNAGVILGFIYGLRIGSLPVNFADLITLILAEAILLIKLKYGWRG